jgi:hypothetical protein
LGSDQAKYLIFLTIALKKGLYCALERLFRYPKGLFKEVIDEGGARGEKQREPGAGCRRPGKNSKRFAVDS